MSASQRMAGWRLPSASSNVSRSEMIRRVLRARVSDRYQCAARARELFFEIEI